MTSGALEISVTSTQYLELGLEVDETISNITSLVVRAAVVPVSTTPVEGDWKAAGWIGSANKRKVRVLVGPTSDVGTLVIGTHYRMWVEVTGSPEKPRVVSDNRVVAF